MRYNLFQSAGSAYASEAYIVDKWAGKSRDEVLEDHKRSIMFYLEHGNPRRKELLKKLADNELAYFGRVMSYPKYEEVRKQIAELV